ncbi:MAG: alpha/beta fold hydrolase [Gemmatimonadetes bacterium]|nr:alpha/beta fold hydrolase [Gemmatimonadota bacterium]
MSWFRARWWWLALLAAVLAIGLVERPRSQRPPHRAEWLEADGISLRTVRAGRGDTTLFLIHGFGESLFTWRAVFDQLAGRHRVVAVDLPGFGGSEKPDSGYTLDSMTDHLAAFVDRWLDRPLVLVGHSMGGQLAASLAAKRPDRVAAVILIAPAGWAVGLGGIADTISPTKARAIGWYLSSRAFLLPEHDLDWLEEPPGRADYSLMTDPAYRRSTERVLGDFDFSGLRDRFRLLTQPVLLVWGELDPVIPYGIADSIRGQLRCSKLTSFPTALHRPQVELPDTTASAILSFVANPSCIPSIRD